MRVNLIYARFLDYFNNCLGCTGKRDIKHCRYAVVCAVAEVLAKKGLVKNAEELLVYGVKVSDKHSGRDDQCFAVEME